MKVVLKKSVKNPGAAHVRLPGAKSLAQQAAAARAREEREERDSGGDGMSVEQFEKAEAALTERVIEECKRVWNGGVTAWLEAAQKKMAEDVERILKNSFETRIRDAVDGYLYHQAEVLTMPYETPFAELCKLMKKGWHVMDVRSHTSGSMKSGILLQRHVHHPLSKAEKDEIARIAAATAQAESHRKAEAAKAQNAPKPSKLKVLRREDVKVSPPKPKLRVRLPAKGGGK